MEDWRKCIEHVKKIEDDYWSKDVAREHLFETFIINIENDSSDDRFHLVGLYD